MPRRARCDLEIEMHAHDDLGMATANKMVAVKAGVTHLNTTVNGLGERSGNAQLEEVVLPLQTKRSAALSRPPKIRSPACEFSFPVAVAPGSSTNCVDRRLRLRPVLLGLRRRAMQDCSGEVRGHFSSPRNSGPLADAIGVSDVGMIQCGDTLRLRLKVNPDTGIIDEAHFQTFGDGSIIAPNSALTAIIKC